MIKILNGIHETVSFDEDSPLMLYDNTDFEEYPTHWHTPVEIVMPLVNGYDIECNDISFHLRVGDIIIIAPGVLHKIYAEHGQRIIFQADMKIMNAFKEFESFFSFMQPAAVITPEDFPTIHEDAVRLMKECKDEYFSNAPLRDASICSKLLQMLVMVSRVYTTQPNKFTDIKPNKQQEYIEKFISVCDYINQHCTEDLTLDDMADRVGFSKYHFSRLFKEFTNVSFYKYLNGKRIAYAEKLLLDPEINVMEAAVRSGYNSISAFMRMFKIIKNCTPTEFRKMYKP